MVAVEDISSKITVCIGMNVLVVPYTRDPSTRISLRATSRGQNFPLINSFHLAY